MMNGTIAVGMIRVKADGSHVCKIVEQDTKREVGGTIVFSGKDAERDCDAWKRLLIMHTAILLAIECLEKVEKDVFEFKQKYPHVFEATKEQLGKEFMLK